MKLLQFNTFKWFIFSLSAHACAFFFNQTLHELEKPLFFLSTSSNIHLKKSLIEFQIIAKNDKKQQRSPLYSKKKNLLSTTNPVFKKSIDPIALLSKNTFPTQKLVHLPREESGIEESTKGTYLFHVHNKIRTFLRYPLKLQKKGVSGKLLVLLKINREGKIESTQIKDSSGHFELDQLALEAISRAAPFSSFQDFESQALISKQSQNTPVMGQNIHLNIPIDFQLRKTL